VRVSDQITPWYRAIVYGSIPAVTLWGRLEVLGLEQLPATGPVLLCGNHDSYWDTVTAAVATRSRRQIRALAKSSLWKNAAAARILDGMGQIPIDRGKGDTGALDRAVEELRENGICLGVFPEGTRSLGRQLRARSGFGRLAALVPEAKVVCVAITGTVDIPKFPTDRPRVRVEFFLPSGGPLQPDEPPSDYTARLLTEIRSKAPHAVAGRARGKRIAAGADPEADARASGQRAGG
jgi:1-acyl-sn-glycerol-3-phosphate acyltransferase